MKLRSIGLVVVLALTTDLGDAALLYAQPCRSCPPSSRDFQAELDAAEGTYVFPAGTFTISRPLFIRKSLDIAGAGRCKTRRRCTEIKVVADIPVPAFAIEGDIQVKISDLVTIGGGIKVGRSEEPCAGIDDPTDQGNANLELSDLAILGSAADAIRFRGGALTVKDVQAENAIAMGAYVADATGDIVFQDYVSSHHGGWGLYICNREGSGLIYLNDVTLNSNFRGGLAIVGQGGPSPDRRPVCLQNSKMLGNLRFGMLLFDVAPDSLVYNVHAAATFPGNGSYGDGIAIALSEQVVLWDVTAAINDRAGISAWDCLPGEPEDVLFVGDLVLENNGISLDYEHLCELPLPGANPRIFSQAVDSALVNGCGGQFLAPANDDLCIEDLVEVQCQAKTSGLAPPDYLTDP